MNKTLIIIATLVLILVGAGAYMLTQNQQMTSAPVETSQQATQPSQMPSPSEAPLTTQIKEFTVNGSNMKFEPNTMTVKKGDIVRITFKNVGGMHDFVIDEYNVKTKVLKAGTEEVVEFVADKTGSFEYYCSVGNHRAMGMKGTLVVQ